MIDRLGQLLSQHERLYGVICRDATLTDIELMAQVGYHIIWLDLEHSPQPAVEAIRLGRSIAHLGMVSLVRIPELSRTHVQILLDGGIQILSLPDVRDVQQAIHFAHLGKYPPVGARGISSSSAGIGFTLDENPQQALRQVNEATHLMAMVESDEGYEALNAILAVEEVDMISVGPNDWSASLGIFGDEAEAYLAPRIERVISAASGAGKITTMTLSSPEQAEFYHDLGVRVFFVGVDVNIKRRILSETLRSFQQKGKGN